MPKVTHIAHMTMVKRKRDNGSSVSKHERKPKKTRKGFTSVPRTRGASVQGEMKYFDTERAAVAIAATADWTNSEVDPATFNTLFVPVVGAAVNQRIGKAAKVMKIRIRGTINAAKQGDQTGSDNPSIVRYALVQDFQTNSAQAQGEQVFATATAASSNVFVHQNVDNFGRFRVLHDKTVVLQNPNSTYDGTNIEQQGLAKPFKISHVFQKPVEVRFNATNGGTVADIVDNSWHMLANSSNGDLAPTISYICRVYYKE